MKRLGISQRVEHISSYGERRDCLDQRWSDFALQLGYLPMPLPNIAPDQVAMLLDNLDLDGIILSGGNSLTSVDSSAEDTAPERDKFESALINGAIERDIPIIGVCRGMQVINIDMGGTIFPITGHVAKPHQIVQTGGLPIAESVNSFHNWTIPEDGLASDLTPLAFDKAGNVEAFECPQKNILGVMWHLEREQPFSPLDLELIRRYLA